MLWTNGKRPPEAKKKSTVLTRGGAERRTKFDHFDGPGGAAGPKKIDGNLTRHGLTGGPGRTSVLTYYPGMVHRLNAIVKAARRGEALPGGCRTVKTAPLQAIQDWA